MAEGESGYKWWIRYVLVPVITGGGIIAVLVAHFLGRPGNVAPEPARPVSAEAAPAGPSDTPPGSGATPTPAAEVRALSLEWLGALVSRDLDRLAELSDTPFYFQRGLIVHSRSELRNQYTSLLPRLAGFRPEVRSINLRTVEQERQLRHSNYAEVTRILDLSPTDQIVELKLRFPGRAIDDGARLLTRKTDGTVKVAGFHIE